MLKSRIELYTPAVFFIVLFLWAIMQWDWARPVAAAADWMGWRQADTQTIANNFKRSGNDIFHPQIDWRGAGPGFVETEFSLYPYLASKILPTNIVVEWPSQAISLLAMTLSAVLLFITLQKEFGAVPALIAGATILANLGVLHLATAIQPDALCFLLYTASLCAFYRYIRAPNNGWLALSTVLTLLAALVKPPALHLGMIQFFALLYCAPRLLTRPQIWISWLIVLAGFSAYIYIAHQNFINFGNTFGIGFGGDAKWPTPSEFLTPGNYYRMFRLSMTWGLGIPGTIAIGWLIIRKKFTGWETALLIGLCAHLIVSMRYSSSEWLASHYHVFGVFLGAWCVAHAISGAISLPAADNSLWLRYRDGMLVAAIVTLLILSVINTEKRIHHKGIEDGERFLSLQTMIKSSIPAYERIVVRSTAPARVDGWGNGSNNFEDPRIFYLTRTTGWVLPMDEDNPDALANAKMQGAHYYVHIGSVDTLPKTKIWLDANATKLQQNAFGSLYQLTEVIPIDRK